MPRRTFARRTARRLRLQLLLLDPRASLQVCLFEISTDVLIFQRSQSQGLLVVLVLDLDFHRCWNDDQQVD